MSKGNTEGQNFWGYLYRWEVLFSKKKDLLNQNILKSVFL